MLKIKYPKSDSQLQSWEETLKSMAIAYEVKIDDQQNLPILIEGKKEIKGPEAIQQYILQLEREINQWWYCNC